MMKKKKNKTQNCELENQLTAICENVLISNFKFKVTNKQYKE